jgi:hypothetical protein
MGRINRTAMTDGKSRYKLIADLMGVQPQATTAATAITVEVINRTQMGIGMVVTTDHLAWLADHGPTPLNMEGEACLIKSDLAKVSIGLMGHGPSDVGTGGMAMELPDPLQIPRPGASRVGIGVDPGSEPQDLLHQPSDLQRIGGQPHLGQGKGEQACDRQTRFQGIPLLDSRKQKNRPGGRLEGVDAC